MIGLRMVDPELVGLHEITSVFPPMSDAEFNGLVADVRQHGFREAAWLHDNMVIDGRHRREVARVLGLELPVRNWDGNGRLADFVVSLNLHRRQLDEPARSWVAANLANLGRGGDGSNQHVRANPSPGGFANGAVSQSDAAKLLNVSKTSVERAAKVKRKGAPELQAALRDSKVTTAAAEEIADLLAYSKCERMTQIRVAQTNPWPLTK